MDNYLIIMYLLFGLAIIDLVVGVSNDAVNFLNSAIGSKVASFRTVLIIASVGIIVGASFSDGMMEVARKGIFDPGFFTFENIMYVFLAVLLTDVILLDLYNTLGLPTSTTVSIVFELLGAAFMIGLLVSFENGWGFSKINEIIEFSSAWRIVRGIFLSVIFAFSIGAIIQYFTRLAFTFDFEKNLKKYGAIFSGLAITSITYFLVIKGAKGSTFNLDFITDNSMMVIGVSFVFWTILAQVLIMFTKINPLKFIVLMGTFSLAMAFAGNDLVNFIGVAIAGKQSYYYWLNNGMDMNMIMSDLGNKQPAETILLLASGAIMVVTLWFSSKAKKVTETEVGLGSQEDGDEKFKSNLISRTLVGTGMTISNGVSAILPESVIEKIDERFRKEKVKQNVKESDQPAFDLLRASVNLMVASILISYATSQKMPLSTTYVSFMVAMGSSLADKAWGRESAVYRVAGVVNVIGGWLLTAIIAFLSAAIFGLILYYGEFPAVIALTLLALFLLVRSHITFSIKSKEEEETKELFANAVDIENVIDESKINTAKNIDTIRKASSLIMKSMVGKNKDVLKTSFLQVEKLQKQNEKLQGKIIKYVRKMSDGHLDAGRLYILVFDLMQDLIQNANLLSENCTNHLVNHHELPNREYLDILIELDRMTNNYLNKIVVSIEDLNFENYEQIARDRDRILEFLNDKLDEQIGGIQNHDISSRNSMFQLRILLESKDIITISYKILEVYLNYARKEVVA